MPKVSGSAPWRRRAAARAMLKAVGFSDADLLKPIIGVANTWIETMPCNYNLRELEPLWDCIDDVDLPITFHVSTGRDPRAVGGNGGAIVNYVCHSMETTIEPLVQLIASGVLERHPRLHAGLVESGIGFVPWLLETMDYAHRVHHFFVRPQLPELPSDNFRRQCFATFQEDHVGLAMVEQAREEGRPYAMAFIDVRMPPGWDGIETICRIWETYPELQVVICTAYSDYSWEEMIRKVGKDRKSVV